MNELRLNESKPIDKPHYIVLMFTLFSGDIGIFVVLKILFFSNQYRSLMVR